MSLEDPMQETPVAEAGLEWWQATQSLVVIIVGAGVMALPQLPQKGGMFLPVVCVFICGAAITESGNAMWRGIMAGNRGMAENAGNAENAENADNAEVGAPAERRKNIESYEDFARAAYGRLGEHTVAVILVVYFIGVSAGFALLIAQSMAHLSNQALTTQTWLLVLYPVFAGLALRRNVTAIVKIVPVGAFCAMVLCSIIVVKSAIDGQRWNEWPDLKEEALHKRWPSSPLALGHVVASLFGGFGVNGNVPSVLCEMKDPSHFPFSFKVAMCIVCVIYLLVINVAYYAYGEFMQSDIIDSLSCFPANQTQAFDTPFNEWTGPKAKVLELVCSVVLLVKILIGFPLNLFVVFQSFQTFTYTRDYMKVGSANNIIMRLSIVALVVLIARSIPNFGVLFAFFCSFCGPLLQCLFPMLFSRKIQRDLGARASTWQRRVGHSLVALVAFFTITVGFWESLQDVLNQQP